jgi:hypothetical protein
MSIWFVVGVVLGILSGGFVLNSLLSDTLPAKIFRLLFFYILIFIIVGVVGSIFTLSLLSLTGVS